MKAKATEIVNLLTQDAAVSALVGSRVYWGLGRENETDAVIIFSLEEIVQGATRDTRKFTSTLRCYAPDMDIASDIYEAVKAAMKGATHNFSGGLSGIADSEEKEAVTELTFNLV